MTSNSNDQLRGWAVRHRTVRLASAAGLVILLSFVLVSPAAFGETEPTTDETASPAATTSNVDGAPAGAGAGAATADADAPATSDFRIAGGGAKQIVRIENRSDGTYAGRGRSQLNQINAPRVVPVNIAVAQSTTCTGCETLAVALQISTYQAGSPLVAPQNAAVAVNAACTDCFTVAVAIQYLIPVADHTRLPADVRRMGHELGRELRVLARDQSLPMQARLAALSDLLERWIAFAEFLEVEIQRERRPDGLAGEPLTPLPEETSDTVATPAAQEPSAMPTLAPSPAPTAVGQTPAATEAAPTPAPDVTPEASPAGSPTAPPTAPPNAPPAAQPTTSPPSASPAAEPTTSPPSASPAAEPTTSPPSASPAAQPTTSPPSASPGAQPTTSPPAGSSTPTAASPGASPSPPSATPAASP